MRIGIASCYYHHNYGSMLQAYATQQAVLQMGHEAITIQCLKPIHYMTQSKKQYYFHKLIQPDTLLRKLREKKSSVQLHTNAEVKAEIQKRDNKFNEFYKKHIVLSPLCKNRSELTLFASECNAVIVGSDMLWNPINIEHDYYTLTFVPDPVKRISYATSFGTTVIPRYQRKKAKEFLTRFNSISVREQSGIKVIEDLGVGKPSRVVLDPTLLFTADEWMDIQELEPVIKGRYILCYFLGVNHEHRKMAEQLKKKTGLKIVTLPHLDEYIASDEGFGDYRLFDIGPAEFVNLIRNAEYVLTDSFHGTCFSILNHKKFVTFSRFQATNSESTNTRIDSLLGELHLEKRRITVAECDIVEIIEKEIDYEIADGILEKMRSESCDYLKSAIEA